MRIVAYLFQGFVPLHGYPYDGVCRWVQFVYDGVFHVPGQPFHRQRHLVPDVLCRHVYVPAELKLYGYLRESLRAVGHEVSYPLYGVYLFFERVRNVQLHDFGAGTPEFGLHYHIGIIYLGILVYTEQEIGD